MMCSSCMDSPRTSSTNTSFERTKSANEMVLPSRCSTASMGCPAAIRPSTGSTNPVLTAIDCFSLPFGATRSIDLVAPKGKLKQSMAVNTGLVLPVLGRIAAGQPIEAVEQRDGNTISLADFVRSKEVFVLEVRGESMQDEHIMDGDYVLVEKTKVGRNGDLVVALVNGDETTLKRFYKEGDRIRLQPSNASMQPIIVPAAAVELQGKVIGVLRKY